MGLGERICDVSNTLQWGFCYLSHSVLSDPEPALCSDILGFALISCASNFAFLLSLLEVRIVARRMATPYTIIGVVGATGVGKSTFIRHATGLADEVGIGHGLESRELHVLDYP